MKKIFLFLLLFAGSAFANIPTALQAIVSLPEGKKVWEQAESNGEIKIYFAPFPIKSYAMWSSHERAIILNSSMPFNYGEIVRSVLFEMHNAVAESEFCKLDRLAQEEKISRNAYIEAVERIEFENALKTVRILDKGIRMRIFPVDARWHIYKDFDSHFRIQLQTGHSHVIGVAYDYLTHYGKDYAYLEGKMG